MNIILKHTLVAIAILGGLLLICLGIRTFLFADFFSGPSERECVKTAEQFLGYKLGRKYELLDYDADFSHPDRQLNFSIKIPEEKFQEIVAYCEREAAKESEPSITKDGKYDIITSPIQRGYRGFEKTEEVLWGEDRVHYQRIDVILDEGIIEFVGMSY